MGRRTKPGTPGRTTIPPEVVSWATELLQEPYRRHGDDDYELFVVPQQRFVYVEIERRDFLDPGRVAVKSSTARTRTPMGRFRFVEKDSWIYEPYIVSGETWDTRDVERGQLDALMLSGIVRRFCS